MGKTLKKTIYIALGLLVIGYQHISAQSKDTLLSTVLSKPFFYNVVSGKGNKIFTGTSEGIFEIKNESLVPFSDQRGYIAINQSGDPIINKQGIKHFRNRQYSHLLPYPEMGTERSYNASSGNQFYLCSGGRLYIFDIMPYEYSYPNHSIRSISKDLVGTYSGIYLKNKKMDDPAPPFTDGYVRQIGQRGFVCSYQLLVLEKEAMETGQLEEGKNCFIYTEPSGQLISDILPSFDGKSYYLATQDKLLLVSHDFKKDSMLFRKNEKDQPIRFIDGDGTILFFTSGKELYSMWKSDNRTKAFTKLNEPIMGGVSCGGHLYLITPNALYRNDKENQPEKLTDIEQAHTIMNIGADQLLIGTDIGLYHYNIATNNYSVVVKSVEFNRGALYNQFDAPLTDKGLSNTDNVLAGSINGLYTIRVSEIPELIAANQSQLAEEGVNGKTILFISIITLLSGSLVYVLWWFRKRLRAAKMRIESLEAENVVVTREKVEEYVMNNLAVASLKTLMDEFQLNTPQLYEVLKPEKPGSIIQRIRTETVRKMREEGRSVQEISSATGLSVSYLRKLK